MCTACGSILTESLMVYSTKVEMIDWLGTGSILTESLVYASPPFEAQAAAP